MTRFTCLLGATLALGAIGCDDGGTAAADAGPTADMAALDMSQADMSESDMESAPDMAPDMAPDLGPPPPAPFAEAAAIGTWVSETCEPSEGEYIFRQLTLTDGRWQVFGTVFDDRDCTDVMFAFDLKGSWQITGGSRLGEDVAEATFTLETSVWTVHQDIFAMAFTVNACGSDPWEVGVPQDISATGCIGFAYPVDSCPNGEMDLLRLADGRLQVGDRGVDLCQQRAVEVSAATMRPMPDAVEVDSPLFYPEGVAFDAERALYTGSFTTGEIRKAGFGEDVATTLVEPGALGGGALGLKVRDGVLWACATDLEDPLQSALVQLDPADGAELARFPIPGGGICNDITFAEDGTAYITESSQNDVLRLAVDGDALEPWFDGADLAPTGGLGFGFNGLVVDVDGSVLVGRVDDGTLTRIPVLEDGSAGAAVVEAVEPVEVTYGIDGMQLWRGYYYAVRDAKLVRLYPGDPWTSEVVVEGDDFPATVAIDRTGNAWLTESKFGLLFDGDDATHAEPPFRVVRHTLY